MPRNLAAGLLNAAAQYQTGRNARQDRDYTEFIAADRNRIADEDRRLDNARQDAMMRASAESMRQQRERQAQMDARQAEQDRMNAAAGGMTEVSRAQDELQGLLGDAAPTMKGPTYQIGGQVYTKTRPSDVEQRETRQAQARADERAADAAARAAERTQQQQWQTGENAKNRAATMGAKLRAVPAGTMKDYQGIQANLRELQDIEAAMTTDPKSASEALGLRNMLPEWAATRGMSDPALTLRGKLSNVASGIFLERSGAAVTPSEAKRLEGWTANMTDNPKKALNAIRNMRAFYEQKVADMQGAYGEETGYRPLAPGVSPAPAQRPPISGGWR